MLALAHLATSTNASTGDAVGVDLLRSGFGDPAALDGFAESPGSSRRRRRRRGPRGPGGHQAGRVRLPRLLEGRAGTGLGLARRGERREAGRGGAAHRQGQRPEISEGAATDFIRAFPGGAKAKQKRADRKKADQDLLDHVAGDASIELKDEANKNRPSPVEGPAQLFIMGAPRAAARCSTRRCRGTMASRRTATLRPC